MVPEGSEVIAGEEFRKLEKITYWIGVSTQEPSSLVTYARLRETLCCKVAAR